MIFFAGHHNTGKSTAAVFLKENYGFCHIETGAIVRNLYIKSKSRLPFGEWANQHKHFFDEAIVMEIKKCAKNLAQPNRKTEDIIITGNRQIEGIHYIIDHIKPLNGRENLIVYFEANLRILHARHMARTDRPTTRLSFDEFVNDLLNYDQKMGVEKIKEYAHITIRNEDSIQNLLELVVRELRFKGYNLPKVLELDL